MRLKTESPPFEKDKVEISTMSFNEDEGKWAKELAIKLKQTTEWGVHELDLGREPGNVDRNRRPTVVKEISHIYFPNLTWLRL